MKETRDAQMLATLQGYTMKNSNFKSLKDSSV